LVARKKWELYESAYEEVFEKTSLSHAPWYLIPSNKKWSRNLLIAQIICATLDNLHLTYPKVKFNSDDTLIT
ncbi:MAG: polyphosphate kinase, partial [Puniceicoccaceae bacterium MED-G32]